MNNMMKLRKDGRERHIYTKEMHKIGHWGGIKEPDKCQKCVPE